MRNLFIHMTRNPISLIGAMITTVASTAMSDED